MGMLAETSGSFNAEKQCRFLSCDSLSQSKEALNNYFDGVMITIFRFRPACYTQCQVRCVSNVCNEPVIKYDRRRAEVRSLQAKSIDCRNRRETDKNSG